MVAVRQKWKPKTLKRMLYSWEAVVHSTSDRWVRAVQQVARRPGQRDKKQQP